MITKDKNDEVLAVRQDGERTRVRIMEFVRNYWFENCLPPRIKDVSDSLGMSTSHVSHHFKVLERQGLIIVRRDLGRVEPIPAGMKVGYEY